MQVSTQWLASGQHREEMQRSLTVSSAGSVLLQTTINRVVTSLVLRHHGLNRMLDHKTGSGNAAYVNRRAERDPSGQWLDDTTEPGVVGSTYTQASFSYCSYVTRGKVSRKLQATGRSYADILAQEIAFSVEDHADGLEKAYIQGNSAALANQCNGLITLVNAVSGQVVANTSATAGDAVNLDKLDEAIDLCIGEAMDKFILVSQKGGRKLNAALQAQQQFNDSTEIEAGFRVKTYDGIPVVKSTRMPDDMDVNATGAVLKITGESSEPVTAIAVVNRRYVWIEDLTATSVLPLAKSTSQYDQFDVFTDTALVLHNTKGATLLTGIK